MNRIKLLFLESAAMVMAFSIQAEVIVFESFDYPNGPLTEVASGLWQHHSGSEEGEVNVDQKRLALAQAESEDIHRVFEPLDESSTVYAAFQVQWTELPSGSGGYFAHFKPSGNSFRGRVFVAADELDPDRFRIGIANKASSAEVWLEETFALQQPIQLVVGYDSISGWTTLWANPGTGTELSVQSQVDPSPILPEAFAFRQSSGIGDLLVDNLIIATRFDEAVDSPTEELTILSQPEGMIVNEGDLVTLRVLAVAPDLIAFQWRFNGTDIPDANAATFVLESVASTDAGVYTVWMESNGVEIISAPATVEVNAMEPIVSPPVLTSRITIVKGHRPGDDPNFEGMTDLAVRVGETVQFEADFHDENQRPLDLVESLNALSNGEWEIGQDEVHVINVKLSLTPESHHAGQSWTIAISASNPDGTAMASWTVYVPTPEEENVVINEFLANPIQDETNPLFNPLGRTTPPERSRISAEDEFIEILNRNDTSIDLSGWSLSDAVTIRHVFPEGTVLMPGETLLVIGGHESGSRPELNGILQSASENGLVGLALNNGGDRIELRTPELNLVERIVYPSTADNLGSFTRFPDAIGDWADHATTSDRYASPGLQTHGEAFSGPIMDTPTVQPVEVSFGLEDDRIVLTWDASQGGTFSIWSAGEINGAYTRIDRDLKFGSSSGRYEIPVLDRVSTRFYRVSLP